MRRLLLALLVTAAALAAPQSGSALPTPGFASANVEWLGNIPLHADSAGARLHGGYLYVTSSTQLSIYDARVPESPRLLSTLPIPQTPYFAEEDVDTNGAILLISTVGKLVVIDVRDKARPGIVSTLDGADQHTVSCVLDCRWAYGSHGLIVDPRDPAKPRRAGDWRAAIPGGPGSQHDVTEVSPGLVTTSTEKIALLDARSNPAKPRLLARGTTGDGRFIHANLWPRGGKDRFLLVGGESAPGRGCADKEAGAFMTWDTTAWQRTGRFSLVDSYRPKAANVPAGGAAYETFCSHWFTPRPGWKDGGQLAVGWYEHGTRFLRVTKTGAIAEIGYFVPAATTASAAYWVTKDIVYVIDYQRGLDVLRFHDKPVTRPVAPGAAGLKPYDAPAVRRELLPGMLSGWRC